MNPRDLQFCSAMIDCARRDSPAPPCPARNKRILWSSRLFFGSWSRWNRMLLMQKGTAGVTGRGVPQLLAWPSKREQAGLATRLRNRKFRDFSVFCAGESYSPRLLRRGSPIAARGKLSFKSIL